MDKIHAIYKMLPRDGFSRRLIIQNYLILLSLFNFLLNLTPFFFWKYFICSIGGINLGKGAVLCSGVRFLSLGKCRIGARTVINRDCLLDNRSGLLIGEDVSIANGVKIFTQSHDIEDEDFKISGGMVEICDHACIYSSALIMPKIKLGMGCVVYAGSVVVKNINPLEVVGGNPAYVIRKRKLIPGYKLKSGFWFM